MTCSLTLHTVVCRLLLIKLPLLLLVFKPLPHFDLFLPQKLVHELLRSLSKHRAGDRNADGYYSEPSYEGPLRTRVQDSTK
jgi:hypothetical protein